MTTPTHMVELRDVQMQFEEKKVLDDFSLKVEPRERLVIMGQTGSGKSTILRLILGTLRPDAHCLDRFDFLGHLHGAELGGESRTDPGCQHDAGKKGPELARETDRDQSRDQPLCAKALQLITSEQRHR